MFNLLLPISTLGVFTFNDKHPHSVIEMRSSLDLSGPERSDICQPDCGEARLSVDLALGSMTDVADVCAPYLQDCVPFDIP